MINYIKNMKHEGFIRSCLAGVMLAIAFYGATVIIYGMQGE